MHPLILLLCLAAYLGVVIALGWRIARRTRAGSADFFRGGRKSP